MKILEVIHGFPPYYMAGSEVYCFNLCNELNKYNKVHVFSRIENPFLKSYEIINEKKNGIYIVRINKDKKDYSLKDKYLDENIDKIYRNFLEKINPDIVHIQHVSHLSTNIVNITKEEFKKSIVFTIHDFWMFCPRGQLLTPEYKICEGPEIDKCRKCLNYLHVNKRDLIEYKKHMERVLSNIDIFLAPSKILREFYIKMGIPSFKVIYSPYGFNKSSINYRKKEYSKDSKINFGFVGRIIPPKGIHLLIKAFSSIKDKKGSTLKIYGDAGKSKIYLKEMGDEKSIKFMDRFNNKNIDKVLDNIDVLVVPSIWYENSPLVIQEAFLKGVPVVTSNIGGMKELVNDGIDGYLFKMGDIKSLKDVLENIIKDPSILNNLKINRDKVRSIEEDAQTIVKIFGGLLNEIAA